MIVEQCMSKSPRACTPADTLSTVARLLWEQDVGSLPVVDSSGAVVGMITDRDVCMAAYTAGLPLHATTVGRHMSRTVFSIGAKADTSKAADLMRTRKVRRVPVVENGRLVGIVTLADLTRSVGKNGRARGVDTQELLGVLSSVSEPRAPSPAAALPTGKGPKTGKVRSVSRAKPRTMSKRR